MHIGTKSSYGKYTPQKYIMKKQTVQFSHIVSSQVKEPPEYHT